MFHVADGACSALGIQVGKMREPCMPQMTICLAERSSALCVSYRSFSLPTSVCLWVVRTRALKGSLDVLNELLEQEGCDVDYTNRLEGATPLHLAVKFEEPELRAYIVDSLLDAGANTSFVFILTWSLFPIDSHLGTCSIKDKAGQVALNYVPEDDTETRNAFRRNQVQKSFSRDDVAGMPTLALQSIPGLIFIDDDEYDEEGGYSGSDEEE